MSKLGFVERYSVCIQLFLVNCIDRYFGVNFRMESSISVLVRGFFATISLISLKIYNIKLDC